MIPALTVLYTAAHGGFDLSRVPLGGAATICDLLSAAWKNQTAFRLQILTPDLLGAAAPREKDLVRFSELQYARFCFNFEKATTEAILKHDPQQVIVLCNDVSEGPHFRRLSERGYRIFTIYHVNVVDYFCQMYLRGRFKPETLARWHARLDRSPFRKLLPRLLNLVFTKQRDSLMFSRGVIVPSEGMKQMLLRCYPGTAAKIHVLPWGVPPRQENAAEVAIRVEELRRRYQISPETWVVITLSRISPEKGQDRLLKALALWEQHSDLSNDPVVALICGEAAYMQGQRFQEKLKALARRLRKIKVVFPGHVAGIEKAAHFRLADLYVFPSRHESYGLTLLEAFQAGLPALACPHYGAAEVLQPGCGELLPAGREEDVPLKLQESLQRLLSDRERLREMGQRARRYAAEQAFPKTAERLAELILR